MHSTMTFDVVTGCRGLKSKVRTRVEKFCSNNNDGILRHYSNIIINTVQCIPSIC